MTVRLVPKDLLDGHELWPPRFRRLVVTGFVTMGSDEQWSWARHVEATTLWGRRLESSSRVSVMSALIELEQLGVCRDIQEHDEQLFSVEVG